MAKQATITEIARRAGVSIGTVDRVLHNRGGVSLKSQEKIQAILKEVGYKINMHTSAVALRKEFKIVISVPQSTSGEYWDGLLNGIRQATDEYSDIHIACESLPYDQFDPASCMEAFSKVLSLEPDAVIIGPTFDAETHSLCSDLDAAKVPYVFVDTTFENTHPLASFTADQPAGGSLVGSILLNIVPPDRKIALFMSRHGEKGQARNAQQRREGLVGYLKEVGKADRLVEAGLNLREGDWSGMQDFFREHPEIGGICVMNSRGHIIADFLQSSGIGDVKIVAFDLTEKNIRCLQEGRIYALVCQRPERQGFLAVTTLLEYLLYKRTRHSEQNLMPLDIVLKENLPFYK